MDYDLQNRVWKRRGVVLRIKKEPFVNAPPTSFSAPRLEQRQYMHATELLSTPSSTQALLTVPQSLKVRKRKSLTERREQACGSMRSAHMMSDLTLPEDEKAQFVAKISRDPKENRQVTPALPSPAPPARRLRRGKRREVPARREGNGPW